MVLAEKARAASYLICGLLVQRAKRMRIREGKPNRRKSNITGQRKPGAISAPGWVDSAAVQQSPACLLVQWLSLRGGLGLGT